MFPLKHIVCIYVLVCSSIDAARILAVFPTPSISHQVVFRPLTKELARRGHEVVVITTDPAFPKGQTPENLTEIDVHDISYKIWRQLIAENTEAKKIDNSKNKYTLIEICLKVFEGQTEDPVVKDIILNQKQEFDLLLVEAWTRYILAFSHIVKVPVVAVSSLGAVYDHYDLMGAPIHPVLYPQPTATRVYNLSPWEKIVQYYTYYQTMNTYKNSEEHENSVVRKIFGENTPPLSELQSNIGMLFVNVHPLFEGNRPVPPAVVHIGRIHLPPEKELPKDLKEYLDSSKHGVIYLSFGSNIDMSTLPPDKIQAFINVFSHLPYDVLWKWNQDDFPGQTENIRISKWFPQSDLLRHPKIKLFITQGGLQSTDETITAGVPVIGIPIAGDQFYNVEKYEHFKIGKKILIENLDEEILMDAIKTVIEEKSYRENVVRLRTLMDDQPQSSLERAVWWTEHVLRHGARHLRAPAANMAAADYYELNLVLAVLAVVMAVALVACIMLYTIIKVLVRCLCNEKKIKTC